MAQSSGKGAGLVVEFVDLDPGSEPPKFAAYQIDAAGRAVKKVAVSEGGKLDASGIGELGVVAFGPDVDDPASLSSESLASFRVAQVLDQWRKQGIVLGRDIWDRFRPRFACISGTVSKCRPWYWGLLEDIRVRPLFALAQQARIKPIDADILSHVHFPFRCTAICDGIVEVYERVCCCTHIHIPDLIDKLRQILDHLPIPLPDPIPDPGPAINPGSFATRHGLEAGPAATKARAQTIQARSIQLDLTSVPSEDLYRDYLALRTLEPDAAQLYVSSRPYLYPLICFCSVRKVGQTAIQPAGHFSFCYRRSPLPANCLATYGYVVKQFINGAWTVVYNGLSAHQYFGAGSPALIHSYSPIARVCTDGPGNPPPNDGLPFVMLEHVGTYGTFHFNFPAQTAVSQVGALDTDDGTYATSYAPDCPWGSTLGIRLWVSPELQGTVEYYRIKVSTVNDVGVATGSPSVLADSVTWDKLVDIPGDVVRVAELLGPFNVGTETNLFKVPYWSSPDHRYLSDQYHQVWNTALSAFPDGKYILIIEVFDGAGNRIKPTGATGPGAARPFQFRRWHTAFDTDPVPFADAAHIFWVDNTPVGGDIVDLRRNGLPNTAECQFMTGPGSTTFSIGLRAYHAHGVDHAGNGDHDSFMYYYDIGWQRGLNGSTGTLGFAPSGGDNHTDVGETGGPVASGTETFTNMLTSGNHVLSKCTFSVSLHVYAKHFTGSGRISAYDYHETASFALEII